MKESRRAGPSTPPIWASTSVYHIQSNANCFLRPTHPYEKLESKMGDTFLLQPAGVIIMVSQSEVIFFLVSLVETSVSCSIRSKPIFTLLEDCTTSKVQYTAHFQSIESNLFFTGPHGYKCILCELTGPSPFSFEGMGKREQNMKISSEKMGVTWSPKLHNTYW